MPAAPLTVMPSARLIVVESAPDAVMPSAPLTVIPSAPDGVIPSAPPTVIPFGPNASTPSAPLTVIPFVAVYRIPSAPLTVIPFEPTIVSPARAGTELSKVTSVSATTRLIFLNALRVIEHKPTPQSGQTVACSKSIQARYYSTKN